MSATYKATLFVLCLLTSVTGWANGGPVDWTKDKPIGGIVPRQENSVDLLSETLNISVINLNQYEVDANYVLRNQNDKKRIIYGVPLRWLSKLKTKEAASGILITVDKKSYNCHAEDPVKNTETDNDSMYKREMFGEFGDAWCIAEIDIPKGDEIHLRLRYTADLEYEDLVFSKSPLTVFSPRTLIYPLAPAGYWNGNVSKVNILINKGPYSDFTTVKHPDGYKIDRHTIKWSLSNVDFKKEQQLEIVFSPKVPSSLQLGSWNVSAPEYVKVKLDAQASSTLQDVKKVSYKQQNATDGDRKTAWCEGVKGFGEGEWIKFDLGSIKFAEYCNLKGVAITPGYAKSQKAYSNNNRITKIKISECTSDKGHVFDIPLQKNHITSPFLIGNSMPPGAWDKFITEYRKKHGNNYATPDYKPPSHTLDFIREQGCFKVEILDVERGKYDDSCISEVSVVMNCG